MNPVGNFGYTMSPRCTWSSTPFGRNLPDLQLFTENLGAAGFLRCAVFNWYFTSDEEGAIHLVQNSAHVEIVRPSSRAEELWQRRLLPFMIGSLAFVALAFMASTLWFFRELQARLEFRQDDVVAALSTRYQPAFEKVDLAYRDWYVRAALEQTALQQRFNVQTAIVKARLWTRFMGFITGMLLALTGCVFVLGKLRESINFTGQSTAISGTLATSSPGVFLALLGTVIIGISLTVQANVESTDSSVYLARQIQLNADGGMESVGKPSPLQLPGNSTKQAQTNILDIPPMPPAITKKIQEQAAKAATTPVAK